MARPPNQTHIQSDFVQHSVSVRVLVGLVAVALVPFMSAEAHHGEGDAPDAHEQAYHAYMERPHFLIHWSDVMEQGGAVVIDTGTDEDGRCLSIRGRMSGDFNTSGEFAMSFERMQDQPCTYRVHASKVDDPGPRAEWRTQPSTQ